MLNTYSIPTLLWDLQAMPRATQPLATASLHRLEDRKTGHFPWQQPSSIVWAEDSKWDRVSVVFFLHQLPQSWRIHFLHGAQRPPRLAQEKAGTTTKTANYGTRYQKENLPPPSLGYIFRWGSLYTLKTIFLCHSYLRKVILYTGERKSWAGIWKKSVLFGIITSHSAVMFLKDNIPQPLLKNSWRTNLFQVIQSV